MNTHTITREQIETLASQRDAQCAAVENAFFKEHGARAALHVSTLTTWAHVEFPVPSAISPGNITGAIPVHRLLKWAATFDKGTIFRVGFTSGFITLASGSSRLKIGFWDSVKAEELPARSGSDKECLGAVIVCEADADGVITIKKEHTTADRSAMRAASKSERQQKQIEKAKAECGRALSALRTGAKEYNTAAQTIETTLGGIWGAIATAKKTRIAWGVIRGAKKNPSTFPYWGKWHAELAELIALESKAKKALLSEEKLKTWQSMKNRSRADQRVADQIGVIKRAIDKAGREYCAELGVSCPLMKDRPYSRARLTVKQWPAKKIPLALEYMRTLETFRALQITKATPAPIAQAPTPPPVSAGNDEGKEWIPGGVVCEWKATRGKKWFKLLMSVHKGRYTYAGDGCSGGMKADNHDDAIAQMESRDAGGGPIYWARRVREVVRVTSAPAPVSAGTPIAEPAPIAPGVQFKSARYDCVWTVLRYHRGGNWVCEEPDHHTTCHFHESEIESGATLTLYRVTESEAQWIDAEIAAEATETPIPATPAPIPALIAPLAAVGEEIESFTYLDTAEEIERKLGVLERNRGKLLASIAEALASPERMARMQKWQNRTAKEWLRNEIVKLCHTARSWALSNGMGSGLCHRDKATNKQLAARRFLIAELNVWREARRIYLASIAPTPLAVNVTPLAVCEREEPIPATKAALDEVFSSFPSLRALFAREKEHIIPFPDQHEGEWREAVNGKAVSA
jgi:hypothetical protein